jgi:hypothetical protein
MNDMRRNDDAPGKNASIKKSLIKTSKETSSLWKRYMIKPAYSMLVFWGPAVDY